VFNYFGIVIKSLGPVRLPAPGRLFPGTSSPRRYRRSAGYFNLLRSKVFVKSQREGRPMAFKPPFSGISSSAGGYQPEIRIGAAGENKH